MLKTLRAYASAFAYKGVDNGIHGLLQTGKLDKAPQGINSKEETMLETILSIVFAILTIIGTFVSYYFYIKNKITAQIAAGIDNVEIDGKAGEEKKAEVIEQLKKLVPKVLKPFFTTAVLDSLVEQIFASVKSYAIKKAQEEQAKKETEDEQK